MLKKKGTWLLNAMFILQLVCLFGAQHFFSREVHSIERGLESTLSGNGMPTEQINAISLAVYSLGSSSSLFGLGLGIIFIGTNYALILRIIKEAKTPSSSE